MRIYFYGKLRFRKNYLLPDFSAVDVVDDDDYTLVTHRWYQISWLGWSINLDWPVNKKRSKRALFLSFNNLFKKK